jgi:hypothetical protein
MKKFYGNYLGLCINNDDPQKRGRVQVFIPHIMPALFENWNEVGEDIKMLCVGDNLPDSLPSPVVDKLMKILPWSESASPILGTSSPGNLISNALNAVGNYFNQSPVPTPAGGEGGNTAPNADVQSLFNNAARYGPVGSSKFARARSRDGDCGRGTRQIIGALTNNSYFSNGIGIGGSAFAGSLSTSNNYLQNSGYYNTATSIPSNYVPQIGDVVSGTNSGAGHVQVYIGNGKWVSDFTQNGYLTNYGNLKLHRMNGNGLAAIEGASPGLFAAAGGSANTASVDEKNSPSGTVSAPTPHRDENSLELDINKNNYGSIARPETANFNDINSTGKVVSANSFAFNNDGNTRTDTNLSDTYLPKTASGIPNDGEILGYTIPLDSTLTKIAKDGNGNPVARIRQPAIVTFRDSSGKEYRVLAVGNDTGGKQITGPRDRGWGEFGTNTWRAVQSQGLNVTLGRNSLEGVNGVTATYEFLDGRINNVDEYRYLQNELIASGKLDPSQTSTPVPTEGNSAAPVPGATQSLVNNTDKHGAMAVVNLNNMAKGVFTYPAAGAVLWVFFREGDPNFPVYFAANYGEREWQSAYRMGSDAPGYKPAPTPENPVTSTGGMMNLNGVGGLRWEDTNVPDDPTKDQKCLTIFGYDGSNMHFNEGYHQIFSKFDRRDSVEGDRWETTLGFRERWVQGDSNEVTMGDVFVKIGNVSPPAVDAVTRIQQIIKECMQPVTESSGSAPTTSTAGKSQFSKAAANTSTIQSTPIASTPTSTSQLSREQNQQLDTLAALARSDREGIKSLERFDKVLTSR